MNLFDILLSLSALIVLEIILGIDNLVFLTILTEKLPKSQQKKARRWGLTFAWLTRLLLLATACWMVRWTEPLMVLFDHAYSVRDLFLLIGGFFLFTKATQEIHHEVAQRQDSSNRKSYSTNAKKVSFSIIVTQVALMDIIFSLDSVLTAIGLTQRFWVMALAITCAIWVMLYASEPLSHFIEKYPTIKMLALCFLILIGMVLVADGFGFYIPRGYVYFAMAFSLSVEMLNLARNRDSN